MDWADRQVEKQGREKHLRADPLKGYDLLKEYDEIKAGKSKLNSRIQGMIVSRVETGR